jgi:hypothetical protein
MQKVRPNLNRLPRACLAFAMLACLAWSPVPEDGPALAAARQEARDLLARGATEGAIQAFTRLTEQHPDDGVAWFDLGQAYHVAGNFAAAHDAARSASASLEVRPSAAYNMACASALQGQLDVAAEELEQAIAAGFLDFGLMAIDTDLALLREAGRLPLPTAHEYETLRHGSVKIPYVVLLPEGYDPQRSYPAAMAFSPGDRGIRATDYTLDALWADASSRAGWIVVCAAEPSNGWINHPSHHALNALLSEVSKRHDVDGDRFHFIGLGQGARPAAIYSGMSRKYVASLTLVDNLPFVDWDADDLDELAEYGFPIRFRVASYGRSEAERLQHHLVAAGGRLDVVIDASETPLLPRIDASHVLPSRSAGDP